MKALTAALVLCAVAVLVPVKSNAQISCSVSLQQNSPCAPKPILATAAATSPFTITQYCWRLTNCATGQVIFQSCGPNATFAYVDTFLGNLCLRMSVYNTNGDSCVQTINNILVSGSPTINMGMVNLEGCCGLTTNLTCNINPGCGSIDSLVIQPGCGPIKYFNSCPANIPLVYSCNCPPGLYDITIVAKNSCGCFAQRTYNDTVHIIPKPVAFFTADTTTAHCASNPLNVTFTANNGGPNMTYKWYVDGVLGQTSPAPAGLTFNYTAPVGPNCHTVKLVVVHPSGGGCIDSMIRVDYICNTGTPVASISGSASTTCVNAGNPATLTLNDNSGGGTHTVSWNMSGGLGTQTGNPATYSTTATGTYTVTATVSYGGNCSATATQQVAVLTSQPVASFTYNDSASCKVPVVVTYTATPCNTCSYAWNFQNGSPNIGAGQTVSTTYNNFSSNTNATLTVTTAAGCTASSTIVNPVFLKKLLPKVSFSGSKGCPPKCVVLKSLIPSFPGDTVLPANICWSFPGSTVPSACKDSVHRCFTSPGCYDVKLIVTSNGGCVDSVLYNDSICVSQPPICTATADPDTMCFEADSVEFCVYCDTCNLIQAIYGDFSIDWLHPNILGSTYCWDHMYKSFGDFKAMIITYRDSCVGDTFRFDIKVYSPSAKFKDSVSCAFGDSVLLVNQTKGANRWTWSLCTGDTSNLLNPMVHLPLCDTCHVTITAYNDTVGCIHQYSATFNTPCDSTSVSPSDTTFCAPGSITLHNTSPNTTLTRWDGDPGPGISLVPGSATSHTYSMNTPGIYNYAMINTVNGGCKDTVYAMLTGCKIIPDFGPTSVCLPDSFEFVDLSVDSFCGITHWNWSFGDGSPNDTIPNPVHGYAAAGNYQVTLTLSNTIGCTASITKTVTQGSLVNFNYSLDTTVCPGHSTTVNNTTSGVNLSWEWIATNYNHNDTFYTQSPTFSYSVAGDYIVYMTMQSGNQCTKHDTFTVHVGNPVAAGYVNIDTVYCPNPPVIITFTDTSLFNDGAAWWNFGGAGVSHLDVATFFFSYPGTYVIWDSVATNDGCHDKRAIDTVVVFGPYGDFTYSPAGICACKDNVDFTITSAYADSLTLIYGCNTGYTLSDIPVPGTALNPAVTNLSIPYCITDTCQPQLIFQDVSGCQVFKDLTYVAIDSPVIRYTFDNYGVCVQGSVCFWDSTTYTLPPNISWTTQRLWDFGDALASPGNPNTDTSATPCHYFSQPGGYTVKLFIWSNFGCMDSLVSNIVVIPEYPIANYTADDTLVCAYSPACFHDSSWIYPLTGADYWIWCWGDGTCDTIHSIPDACHIYTNGGTYQVEMTVVDSVGCGSTINNRYVTVVDNPVANAGGDQIACYGTITTLNGGGSTNCEWWPAGLVSNPNICNPTIQLVQDDSVTLRVYDQYGCADTATIHFTVARVFADFTVGTSFCGDDSVCVTDASTNLNGVISQWRYDFGDNSPFLYGADVCHTYYGAPAGSYNIELLITDTSGCVDSVSKAVTILPSPEAAFSMNDTVICSDQKICITDLTTSPAPINSWAWYYGDFPNAPVSGANPPCHQYAPPFQNNYTVMLIVTDQNSCSDTASIVVTVNEVPTANFNWSTSCETTPMPLTSTSTPGDGAINFCQWTLWQGAPSPVIDNNCSTSFQFPPGQFPVQFVVSDVNGCADTIVKTVMVDSVSQLVIYPGDTTICAGTTVDYSVSGVFDQIVWTPNVWLSDPNSSTVSINPLGNISYIVSAANGVCAAASDTFAIHVIQPIPIEVDATPDQIVLGLTSNLTSQIPGQIDSILWSPSETLDCNNCPNPIAQPIATTTYTATIFYSQNNVTCSNAASVTITVLNSCDSKIVFIPNTFTPNGDGINDVFMIRGLGATKIHYFRIFDRWGHLVYETQNGAPNEPKWGWDGTDRDGKQLNSAVFVYTYEIECINGDVVQGQGNVTLVR